MDKDWKDYLTGRGSGSGKYYSFHASRNRRSVEVQYLPEDIGSVRIVILELDTKNTIIVDEAHAHCLWAALSQMAEVKKWQDKIDPGNPKA